ncbi:MAG TPA: hypothetical protein VK001_04625 [Geminicoccaceae bacterium]|nr:hypothetical protein [Geminicoccaceae bacterium]
MGDSIARRADALRDLADSDIKRLRENPEPFPIPCPRCKAPRGEPCVSSMGNYTHTHTPRRNKAEAMGLAIAITAPDVHGTPAREADQPAEWGIECPYCRAPEGKPCRDRHGRAIRGRTVHKDRIHFYRLHHAPQRRNMFDN